MVNARPKLREYTLVLVHLQVLEIQADDTPTASLLIRQPFIFYTKEKLCTMWDAVERGRGNCLTEVSWSDSVKMNRVVCVTPEKGISVRRYRPEHHDPEAARRILERLRKIVRPTNLDGAAVPACDDVIRVETPPSDYMLETLDEHDDAFWVNRT